MGAPLSPLLANCFVENIEAIALDSYFLKHKFWGRYMDDISSVWNYGVEELKSFIYIYIYIYIYIHRGDTKMNILKTVPAFLLQRSSTRSVLKVKGKEYCIAFYNPYRWC